MEEENKIAFPQSEPAISDEQLQNVSGGKRVQKRYVGQVDPHNTEPLPGSQSIQEIRLKRLDESTK